jgi:hypothetical protein
MYLVCIGTAVLFAHVFNAGDSVECNRTRWVDIYTSRKRYHLDSDRCLLTSQLTALPFTLTYRTSTTRWCTRR